MTCGCGALRTGGNGAPDEGVGAIDESKRGEDSGGFAEFNVHAGDAATHECVVHAGQVVEDQRGGVEVFEGNGDGVGEFRIQRVGFAQAQDHAGANHAAGT